MPPATPTPGDEFWWADGDYKGRLKANPVAMLGDRGVNVPADTDPRIVSEALRIVSLLWVDGYAVSVDKFRIDPADEGLLLGKGVWESTRTVGGSPWLWDLHLERMRHTIALLGINVKPERLPDAKAVAQYVQALTSQDVVVRLNATHGRPGHPGMVWMSASLRPLPHTSFRLQKKRSPVLTGQPYLMWKTFHYAARMHVGADAHAAGFDSSLMVDPDDNVLEAAHANVFLRFENDGWLTPAANDQFLPGTVRQYLLQAQPIPVREATIPYSRVTEAKEAFLTNSNIGIVPLTQVDATTFTVGDGTRELIQKLGLR
jgi:4-amino-4-deoxychorismate lyase